MRYINIELLVPFLTEEWHEKARKAYEKVKAIPPDQHKKRVEAIDESSEVWRDLKDALKTISHHKCWYCESAAHRINGDVDHQRPKNEAKDYPRKKKNAPRNYGYWWLAFVWKNYRYSCELCNRRKKDLATNIVGGKGSYFPLLDPKQRIVDECDYDDLMLEEPLLLDPTVPTDPALITFDPDGTARPSFDEIVCKEFYLRAKVSIELYHLNHTDMKTRRQIDIAYEISKLVTKIDKYFPMCQKDKTDVAARKIVDDATRELLKMTHETHEYSAAAIAALETFRKPERPWLFLLRRA